MNNSIKTTNIDASSYQKNSAEEYLASRIGKTRHLKKLTLVLGSTGILIFYFAVVMALVTVREIKNNPSRISDYGIDTINSELSKIQKDIEENRPNPLTKSSTTLKKSLKKLPKFIQERLESSIDAKNKRVASEFFETLPQSIDSLGFENSEDFNTAFQSSIEGDKAQLETLLLAHFGPIMNDLYQKPEYGDLDIFTAVCSGLHRLQSDEDLTPEETFERQVLSIASGLLKK